MSGSGSLVFACVFSCLLWQDVAPRPATRRAAGNPTSLNIPGAGGDTFLSLTLTAGRRGKQRRYPNCSLQTVYPVRDKLNTLLKREAKLIEMDLSLPDYPPNFLQHRLPDYFRPTHWVRTTGREGRRLLVLEDNYDFMSLFFLSIRVKKMNVTLADKPPRCLRQLKSEELLYVVREYLLNDFKIKGSPDEGGSLSRDGHVCHMKAVDKDGTAKFVYECCHLCPEGDVICEEVGYDVWIETLMTLLVVTKVLIILYSPSFLPKSLYLPKPHQGEYIYYRSSVEPRKTLRLRIMDRPDQSHKKVVHISRLKGMKNFREYLSRSRKRGNNGTITCRLQRGCRIFVKSRRLLGENEVPVGIFQAIYQNLFRCRIKHLESLHPCCHKYVCGNPKTGASEGCCRGCCLRPIKWYKLLRRLSRGVLLFICIVPWLIRVGVFYQFEDETVAEKKRFAEEHHLETEFKSLTLHLTPLHILFIVVYSIFAVDSLVFGVISKAMSEKFTYVSRDSFREMRKTSEIGMCSVITRLLVLPFEKHGLLGFLLFPFYFVLLLVVGIIPLMFYLFPFLNLTAKLILNVLMLLPKKVRKPTDKCFDETIHRLLGRLGFTGDKKGTQENEATTMQAKRHRYLSKKKKNFKEHFSKVNPDNNELMLRRWEKPLQFLIIPMCLVSFWSVTLLLMEVLAFFVEVGVYTLMGIVVNAGSILQYMTVSVLVFVYARSELGSVYKTYLAYHKDIHNQLMKLGRDDIAEVAKQDEKDQEKTAFCLLGKLDLATAKNKPFRPEIRLKVKGGKLYWCTRGLLIFLDTDDTPFSPTDFFYKSITFKYYGAPGPLHISAIAALKRFGCILLFLAFVFIVVMAFGDTYRVSTTSQLLATVAGGFVPLLFRYIFITDGATASLDKRSIQFKTEFDNALRDYEERWPVSDILVEDEAEEAGGKNLQATGVPRHDPAPPDGRNGHAQQGDEAEEEADATRDPRANVQHAEAEEALLPHPVCNHHRVQPRPNNMAADLPLEMNELRHNSEDETNDVFESDSEPDKDVVQDGRGSVYVVDNERIDMIIDISQETSLCSGFENV